MCFQYDGVLGDFNLYIQKSLDAPFPEQWISRDGPIAWYPSLAELSCLEFSQWDQMESHISEYPIESNMDQIIRIATVAYDFDKCLMSLQMCIIL